MKRTIDGVTYVMRDNSTVSKLRKEYAAARVADVLGTNSRSDLQPYGVPSVARLQRKSCLSRDKPMTPQQQAGFRAVLAVTEAIRELREVPAGHLYAQLMAQGCSLESFDTIVRTIVNTGLVEKRGDLLRWTGPTIESR